MPNETVTLALPDGATIEAPARWLGRALAVHAPVNHVRGGKKTRGLWVISGHVHGLSAGTFRGPLRDAIALARLWDDAFARADCVGRRSEAGRRFGAGYLQAPLPRMLPLRKRRRRNARRRQRGRKRVIPQTR